MYKNSNKQYYIHMYIRRETRIDIAPDVQFLFNIHKCVEDGEGGCATLRQTWGRNNYILLL